nr:DUF2452 domain-containing protein [uncultured Allomuricauda sp.]
MKKKKPDNVVFNEEEQAYDAFLKPYATSLSSPKIRSNNLSPWKNSNIRKVNNSLKAEFDEVKVKYEQLMEQYEYNNLVYAAKFSFQPIVGETYHLYKNKNSEAFLSILAPNECGFEHLGSFRLGSDHMWEKL